MKRKRFTEEQIIAVLKEHEAGAKTADLARKHRISDATFYKRKAKFGGMDVSEAKRLKPLEDENAKLKKLLAEQMLDVAALRELLSKMVGPAAKRAAAAHLQAQLGLSERRACSIVGANRTMVRYRSRRPPEERCEPGEHRRIAQRLFEHRVTPLHYHARPAMSPSGPVATRGSKVRSGEVSEPEFLRLSSHLDPLRTSGLRRQTRCCLAPKHRTRSLVQFV